MKNKINWFYVKDGVFPLLPFCMCLTEEEWKNVMLENSLYNPKLYNDWCPGDACVYYFDNGNKNTQKPFMILCIKKWKNVDPCEVASYIVHECMHIVQNNLEYICEKNVGNETQAYLLEHISLWAFKEFTRKIKLLEE